MTRRLPASLAMICSAMICLALIAVACSAADDLPKVAAEPAATPTADTPAQLDDADESESAQLREVPPLDLPSGPVGDADAYAALLKQLDPFITDEQRAVGVPWPDLRDPDPVAAYQATAAFQQWMMQNNPNPTLTEAYTVPNSPERSFDIEMFDIQHRLGATMTPNTPPYSMRLEAVVHPAATSITDTLLADVPVGSVAVVYYDSSGSSEMVTESGLVIRRFDGWTDLGPWVAIMTPTDVGWQVWWDELTDPLPPGQDYERGRRELDSPARVKT